MKTILFNLHDLVLVSVAGMCIVLAIISASDKRLTLYSKYLCAALFLLLGLMALDSLFFWGEQVKYTIFEQFPWFLTGLGISAFAVGPTAYWLLNAEVNAAVKLPPRWYVHLIPAIAAPIYLFSVFYRHPLSIQKELILNLAVYANEDAHYFAFLTIKKLSPLIYGLLCTRHLLAKTHNVGCDALKIKHLLLVSLGFSFIFFWVLTTHIVAMWLPLAVSDIMGILGNYLMLALLISLTVSMLRRPQRISTEYPTSGSDDDNSNDNEDVAEMSVKIQDFMNHEKPYLNPQMNIERFAHLLDMPQRQVSNAINRCFEQNFHEYINRHRAEEAKRLLINPDSVQLSILEVAHLSGFNSKATFNRFFKTLTDSTPSAYRQRLLEQPSVNPSNH